MTDLFPHRASITDDGWGLDADYRHHRQREVVYPQEVTVTPTAKVGKLYGPDGRSYRVVREDRPRVRFGFQP